MADQDVRLRKQDEYDGYDYITTHLYYIIIAEKNPSKYMNEIKERFQVQDIIDEPDYYQGKQLVKMEIRYICLHRSMSRKDCEDISKKWLSQEVSITTKSQRPHRTGLKQEGSKRLSAYSCSLTMVGSDMMI